MIYLHTLLTLVTIPYQLRKEGALFAGKTIEFDFIFFLANLHCLFFLEAVLLYPVINFTWPRGHFIHLVVINSFQNFNAETNFINNV